MLIEWIELHSIIGISEVILYNYSTPAEVARVLSSYQNDRNPAVYVNVVQWQYPSNRVVDYFLQHEALNDCIYRAASQGHQYASVNDLDEVLVPRAVGHVTLADFVNDVTSRDVGAFIFQHAYFRRNKTSENDPYLVSMQSLWRTKDVTPPGKVRSKVVFFSSNSCSRLSRSL
jgi:hypothetical protein